MEFLCNNCKLYDDIEKYRIKLNNLIDEKNHKLLDEEIIYSSQVLDNLVYKCVLCRGNLNDFSQLSLKNIFGIHSSFYYYGDKHLFTSMYFYINEGINNNELIYISMQEDLYNKLIAFLEINDVSVEHIKFRPVKELIMSNRHGGLTKLKEKINDICLENAVRKYSGVRWIGQPTYAIQTTSQKDFLDWETNLSEALKDTNASLICIYDAYDYMHRNEFMNEKVIKESLDTHSHILKNSILEEIN